MDELMFPMFSRMTEQENTFNEHLLDNDVVRLADVTFFNDEKQIYENIPDCNFTVFMPHLPKTCEWKTPVDSKDWVVSYKSIDGSSYSLLILDGIMDVALYAERCLEISFLCSDCNSSHSSVSEAVKLLYRFSLFGEETKGLKFESFPDELFYMGTAEELLERNDDWSIVNSIIKMLEDDLEHEKRPSRAKCSKRDIEDFAPWVVDEFSMGLQFVIQCARLYTLSEHLNMFYGNKSKTESQLEHTFVNSISKNKVTAKAYSKLSQYCYPARIM